MRVLFNPGFFALQPGTSYFLYPDTRRSKLLFSGYYKTVAISFNTYLAEDFFFRQGLPSVIPLDVLPSFMVDTDVDSIKSAY